MQLSKRKRRWISVGVGVVGLVTIVGLSDLLFLLPQQTTQTPVREARDNTPSVVTPTTTPITVPQKEKPAKTASGTIEFSL